MAALRFITSETLAVFDLHATGLGPREIAKKMWPKEYTDATLTHEELDSRLDQIAARFLTMGFSPHAVDERLEKLLDRWPTMERLEARVWEKVTAVRKLIGTVSAWST